MVHTNLNTTITLYNVVKQMIRLIPLDWKLNRGNYVLTPSNALTAKAIIIPIQTYVHSGSITLIENDTPRNTRSFMKVEDNQFIQL